MATHDKEEKLLIKALFENAVCLRPDERDAFLEKSSPSQTVQAAVRRLLLSCDSDPRFYQGDLLADRFKIIRFIAAGGMGEVYEAEDREFRERVAVKIILPDVLPKAEAVARFRKEVQLARKVTHPNVCRIFDLFRHVDDKDGTMEEILLVSMELLRGKTLAERLQTGVCIGLEEAVPLLLEVSSALAAAHRLGIVHRDFKPGNVIRVPLLEGRVRAVVTDFGLAIRTIGAGMSTLSNVDVMPPQRGLIGTPAYMAPEQLEGKVPTPASDVYALGRVAYEVTTGVRPFSEKSVPLLLDAIRSRQPRRPSELNDKIPRALDELILRALNSEANERYPSAGEFLASLERIDFHCSPMNASPDAGDQSSTTSAKIGDIRSSATKANRAIAKLGNMLRYYLYISKTKVEMLFPQIPVPFLKGTEDPQDLTAKVALVADYIRSQESVGSVDAPRTWIQGKAEVRFGIVSRGYDIAFFGQRPTKNKERSVLVLLGSTESVLGSPATVASNHSPFHYLAKFLNIVIESQGFAEPHLVVPETAEGVPIEPSPSPDYADAAEIAYHALPPENVNIEFLARVLRTDPPLVIATPLYVALAE